MVEPRRDEAAADQAPAETPPEPKGPKLPGLLKFVTSAHGVRHLVDRKSGKTVLIAMGGMPLWSDEAVARIVEGLWNDHIEGKG